MTHSKLEQSGFTITEIIVGLVVLPVFLYSIGLVVNSTGALNDRSKDLTIAHGLAEEKIEALRSGSFVNLPADGSTIDFEPELPLSLNRPRTAEYTITDVSPSLKQVDILIEYRVGTGTETLNYSSFIGELGVGQ